VSYTDFEASDAAVESMNGQFLMNKAITVQYAFKKDGKGERHGTAAERLLAAQARKNNALPVASRPPPAPMGFGARPPVPGFQGPYQGSVCWCAGICSTPGPTSGLHILSKPSCLRWAWAWRPLLECLRCKWHRPHPLLVSRCTASHHPKALLELSLLVLLVYHNRRRHHSFRSS
jgi:hypothetical protein